MACSACLGRNLLDATVLGATDGVKLAVNVAAMLLVFTAMIAMLNYMIFHWIGGTLACFLTACIAGMLV